MKGELDESKMEKERERREIYVSRLLEVFLCFSLIALVFPISPVLVAAFSL